MAASAHPSGGGGGNNNNNNNNNGNNGNNGNSNGHNSNNNSGNGVVCNGLPVPDNSAVGPTQAALRHNSGLSVEWTAEEQSLLEDLLAEFASETTLVRYAKIALQLRDKTVRDVALRCRWMTKKENGKRRKEDHNNSRKSKDKKEKVPDAIPKSSQVVNRSNGPPYAQSIIPMDGDDGISYQAIGGATGQLLEQSAQALDQISANFTAFKIHDNIPLLCQARNNILSILNDFHDMPEIMKQMPPLPVKLNEELANTILPRTHIPNRP